MSRRSRLTWPRQVPVRARLLAVAPGGARAGAGDPPHRHRRLVDGGPGPGPVARRMRRGGRAGRRGGTRCRCSTPTTRSGSGSCSAMRMTRAACCRGRSPGGGTRWPGRRRSWRCRRTGRARPAASYRGHAVPLEVPAGVHAAAGRAGPGAGRDAVHGGAGGAGGAAVPSWARGTTSRSGPRWRGGPMRRSMTWSGSSSTRWCCAPTCRGTRSSPQCWAGCGSSGWGRWSTRTCRSSGWSRTWPRTGRWPATRCSRSC